MLEFGKPILRVHKKWFHIKGMLRLHKLKFWFKQLHR